MEQVFDQLGEAGIRRFVRAFYRRVREDNVIGPMYPEDDWAGAEGRLADFLIFRCGGPQRYIEERGHPRLRMRHMPFQIGEAERDRWLSLMASALDECEIESPAREMLDAFFAQVAEMMRNR